MNLRQGCVYEENQPFDLKNVIGTIISLGKMCNLLFANMLVMSKANCKTVTFNIIRKVFFFVF